MERLVEKLLKGLDPEQQKVALHTDGPCAVVAGPGAGKTRCLIHRIVAMTARGIPSTQILATTFTKNAADEMNKRTEGLLADLGNPFPRPTISTFHSFGYGVLKENGWSDYQIIKRKKMLFIDILKELGLNQEKYLPEDLILAVGSAKNALVTPEGLRAQLLKDGLDPTPSRVYAQYERKKSEEKLLDFDDMLFYPHQLLTSNGALLRQYQARYRYLMVDECQDNNLAQVKLAELLTAESRNMMLIGDDCQGIYGWRGAVPEYMIEFANRPEVTKIFLTRNYRSTKAIVKASNRVIELNENRIKKDLYTERPDGPAPVIQSFDGPEEEALWVADRIEESINAGTPRNEHAVLYRTNAQSRAVEDALRKKNIPVTIIGGGSFYLRGEIQDIIAYLKLAANVEDDEALSRVYNRPGRYLGKAWFNEFKDRKLRTGTTQSALRQRYSKNYMDRGARALAEQLDQLRGMKNDSPKDLVNFILDLTGAVHPEKTLKDSYRVPEEQGGEVVSDRVENVEEFANMAEDYGTLAEFLAFLEKAQEGNRNEKESQLQADTVKLMSMHRAKGLEFTQVNAIGWSEGILPHRRSIEAGEIEEERRLAYVAISRAKDRVFCSHLAARYGRPAAPSRFLGEAFESELLTNLTDLPAADDADEEDDGLPPPVDAAVAASPSWAFKKR